MEVSGTLGGSGTIHATIFPCARFECNPVGLRSDVGTRREAREKSKRDPDVLRRIMSKETLPWLQHKSRHKFQANVALEVQLRLLCVGGRGQRDDTENTGTDTLG